MNRPEGRLLKLTAVLLLLYLPSERMAAATAGFQPAVNYSTGAAPKAVAIGDFNGDGKPDLAVANNGDANAGDDGNVSILFGNGDGTFQAHVDYPAGGPNVAVADINSDGKLDLITERPQNRIGLTAVLLGNGDGTFQNPIVTSGGIVLGQQLVVSDFNVDGKADVA